MKDMINALVESGFDFDMAVVLSENYHEDSMPIIREYEGDIGGESSILILLADM